MYSLQELVCRNWKSCITGSTGIRTPPTPTAAWRAPPADSASAAPRTAGALPHAARGRCAPTASTEPALNYKDRLRPTLSRTVGVKRKLPISDIEVLWMEYRVTNHAWNLASVDFLKYWASFLLFTLLFNSTSPQHFTSLSKIIFSVV